VVGLFTWLSVPVRLGFLPYDTFTDRRALFSDGIADVLLLLHVMVLLNTAVKAEGRFGWISERYKIFKKTDFIFLFAALPLDLLGFACGISNEACCWLRLNKLFVYLSRSSPRNIVFFSSESSRARVSNLVVTMFFTLHMLASIHFWLGRAQPALHDGPSVSWLLVDTELQDETYDRSKHFGTRTTASTAQRYLFSIYWVAATITVNGAVGHFIPQNFLELIFTTVIMALNMTVYRWIIGEVSSIIMSSDNDVVKARDELERVSTFSSGKTSPRRSATRSSRTLQPSMLAPVSTRTNFFVVYRMACGWSWPASSRGTSSRKSSSSSIARIITWTASACCCVK
jgi:hypothetical protein